MRGNTAWLLTALLFAAARVSCMEKTTEEAIREIDGLYESGMGGNHDANGMRRLEESLSLCRSALERDPRSYELLWRGARSAVELAETARILETSGWQGLFGDCGRMAIQWTDTAKLESPDRVEGHYWQLSAIGLIFDAGDWLAVLSQGLADKAKQDMEAAYRIDRSYLDYTPVFAMAMYWFSLPPWMGRDTHRAMAYLEEYVSLSAWRFEPYRKYPKAAALLLEVGTEAAQARAKALLDAALSDPTPRAWYYRQARELRDRLPR